MKKKIKIGTVCLTRNTFDFNAAAGLYEEILNDLKKRDDIELVAFDGIIMESDEAQKVGRFFSENLVDAYCVISGTFHLGHLVLEIKKICDKPMLLWGLPELPYDGGKIRLNSVCGVNLNASNLVKSGINDFTYTVSNSIDENWLDAVRMVVALKTAHIGIIGYRAHGFFNVGVDELSLYGKFGCIVDHFELSELWNTQANAEDIEHYKLKAKKYFDCTNLPDEKLEAVASLCSKFKTFMQANSLTVLAVRCWPEFAAGFGIAPCASMSILQSEGFLLSCEGDIDCAITMLCHKAIGAQTPFMADLSQANLAENTALMWHCGVAPCNLADGVCTSSLDSYHAGGRGVTAGFVMKSGLVSMARLDSMAGKYRLFMETGDAVAMDKLLSGTYAKVKFHKPIKEVLDKVIYTGVAHHVSLVYDDYSEIFKIFARLKGVEIL